MSEKYLRTRTELPKGDLLVVAKLAGWGALDLTAMQGEVLGSFVPRRLRATTFEPHRVEEQDGSLYLSFLTRGSQFNTDESILRTSSALLWHGMNRYADFTGAQLSADVEAKCDAAGLIDPEAPLSASYEYMPTDVTRQVREDMAARYRKMATLPVQQSFDLMAELEHFTSH